MCLVGVLAASAERGTKPPAEDASMIRLQLSAARALPASQCLQSKYASYARIYTSAPLDQTSACCRHAVAVPYEALELSTAREGIPKRSGQLSFRFTTGFCLGWIESL